MFCPRCGAELSDGVKFCKNCGEKIVWPQPRPAVPAPGAYEAPGPARQARPVVASAAHAPHAASGGRRTPTGAAPSRQRRIAVGVIVCSLAVALVCAGVALSRLRGGQSLSGGKGAVQGSSGTTVITADGKQVESLPRPQIVTVNSAEAGPASPALAGLASSGSAGAGSAANGSAGTSDAGAASGSDATLQYDGSDLVGPVKNASGSVPATTPSTGLSNVVNLDAFYLSDGVAQLLEQKQFAVDARQSSAEFFDIYESNRYAQRANFVTVDSMMHTYHLYFAHLLKNTEKTYLSDSLSALSQDLLSTCVQQLDTLRGTEWEDAAKRSCAFFAVGSVLLGNDASVPSDVASLVQDEVAKIQAASGIADCGLTGDQEDYSQYKPRGYYEGDAQLEAYFRAMMWYGRINFTQSASAHGDPSDLNRTALLITLALDGGSGGTPNADWARIYTVTSFFAGASDDCGYYEYYPLFKAAYGDGAGVSDLPGNDAAWSAYDEMTSLMRAPQISSVVTGDDAGASADSIKGFRLMGQRFSVDESVFQQLVYAKVADRTLPSALDLPAALGSDEALRILDQKGETSHQGYSTQMQAVRADLAAAPDTLWSASLYSQWLYTLNPLLTQKGEGYPSFMQSADWTRKGLQTYLGSYAELKHDTVLYSKQIMAEMGGDSVSFDDRGYVEPEPEVFGRLADLVSATEEGLSGYGILADADATNLDRLRTLAQSLKDIAQKELAGQEPTSDEYDLIRTFGGQLEHFWQEVNPNVSDSAMRSSEAPAATIVDIATDATAGSCLEVGTGKVSTIYVLVPIAGELHLCEGGVYSYYEFAQPISNRLTDSQWREMLGIGGSYTPSADLPAIADWTSPFTVQS